MQSLCRQLLAANDGDDFQSQFGKYFEALILQARERRSQVMRCATEVFAKVVTHWTEHYLKFAPRTIEIMFELVRQKIEVCIMSGSGAIRCILRHCKDDKSYCILAILFYFYVFF